MPTKGQLSEQLNEIFDLDLDWDEMKKEDLELLIELADGGELLEPLAKHQVQKHGKQKVEQLVDDWYPGKYAGTLG